MQFFFCALTGSEENHLLEASATSPTRNASGEVLLSFILEIGSIHNMYATVMGKSSSEHHLKKKKKFQGVSLLHSIKCVKSTVYLILTQPSF